MFKKIKCRTVLSMILFWGQIQNYMIRVSLSLIIVEMVDFSLKKAGNLAESNMGEEICVVDNPMTIVGNATVDNIENVMRENKVDWDPSMIGIVLSSFSWGYICTQILGGHFAEVIGFKIVYGCGILIPAFLLFFHPIAARYDIKLFIFLRFLVGFSEGVTFPCLHAVTARWVPAQERSSFIAQTYFGSTFGLMITFPMCGLIISSLGWEACFYIIAGISFVWGIFWVSLIHTTPASHPRISEEELQEISTIKIERKKKVAPWLSIITSPPVWGTLVTDCCNTWGIVTLSTYGPMFMKTMLGVDIKTNGLLSGLPMITRYFGGVVFARLSDYLIRTGRLPMLFSRKLFNTISQIGPAIFMVLTAYSGCSVEAVIILKVISMFFNGAISSGHFASAIDLTPNFAGSLFGFTNTLSGGAMGSIAPLANSKILQGQEMSWGAWRIVFWVAAAVYFAGNLVYVLLVKAEPQPWNFVKTDNEEAEPEHDEQEKKEAEEAV